MLGSVLRTESSWGFSLSLFLCSSPPQKNLFKYSNQNSILIKFKTSSLELWPTLGLEAYNEERWGGSIHIYLLFCLLLHSLAEALGPFRDWNKVSEKKSGYIKVLFHNTVILQQRYPLSEGCSKCQFFLSWSGFVAFFRDRFHHWKSLAYSSFDVRYATSSWPLTTSSLATGFL